VKNSTRYDIVSHFDVSFDQTDCLTCVPSFISQWKEGDPIPECWKDFYKYNPCVPVDYSTVNEALSVVRTARAEQTRSIRVLLRPGRYILRESILVQAPCSVRVEVATMVLPDYFRPVEETPDESEPPKRRKSSSRFRSILSCRNMDVEESEEEMLPDFEETTSSLSSSTRSNACANRAKLVLRTRRHNEPIVRVRQGCCILRNVDLCHISHGIGMSSNVLKDI
jgi:hypothetical protein